MEAGARWGVGGGGLGVGRWPQSSDNRSGDEMFSSGEHRGGTAATRSAVYCGQPCVRQCMPCISQSRVAAARQAKGT